MNQSTFVKDGPNQIISVQMLTAAIADALIELSRLLPLTRMADCTTD